jgi:large subunit ribosomal protein L6
MSRIGKMPIKIPSGVSVDAASDVVTVNGPKGSLKQAGLPGIKIAQEGDELIVSRANEEKMTRAKHGLMRSLLNNMVTGVSQGFEKKLEIHGVGYRVAQAGSDLRFNLGFSHDVVYKVPADITVKVEQNTLTVNGADKQRVGQVAAEIRALKKPEPYKGKGIRYADERILRKSGKSGKEG